MPETDRRGFGWMALAFSTCFGLAIAIVAVLGANSGIPLALVATGRLAFLLFFPAYVGGALTALFGDVFLPVRKRAREFGLAFAAAIFVHLALVVCLSIVGAAPSARTFAIFGPAAAFTLLLACLSFSRVRRLLPRGVWPPIRVLATNYIALAFLYDFAHFPSSSGHLAYLPFAALAIVGPLLKLAAWAKALGSVALTRHKRARPIKALDHIWSSRTL